MNPPRHCRQCYRIKIYSGRAVVYRATLNWILLVALEIPIRSCTCTPSGEVPPKQFGGFRWLVYIELVDISRYWFLSWKPLTQGRIVNVSSHRPCLSDFLIVSTFYFLSLRINQSYRTLSFGTMMLSNVLTLMQRTYFLIIYF